jgi:hypothetical protein
MSPFPTLKIKAADSSEKASVTWQTGRFDYQEGDNLRDYRRDNVECATGRKEDGNQVQRCLELRNSCCWGFCSGRRLACLSDVALLERILHRGSSWRNKWNELQVIHPGNNNTMNFPFYKPEGRGFETWSDWRIFSIYFIFPAALGSGIYSASNISDYQMQKNNVSERVGSGRCVGLTTLPPSVSQLCRHCGILNISQPYTPARPVTRITLLFFCFTPRRPSPLSCRCLMYGHLVRCHAGSVLRGAAPYLQF